MTPSPALYMVSGKIAAGLDAYTGQRSQSPHDMHVLDVADEVCLSRLRKRNSSGEHPFHVNDAVFAAFCIHYLPPLPEDGFHLVWHTPWREPLPTESVALRYDCWLQGMSGRRCRGPCPSRQ